jgi:lysophospholipase L1-like esterase
MKRFLAVIVVALAAVTLAYQPAAASTGGQKVGVVGDSLIFQAEYGPTTETPELDHRLTDALAGYRTVVKARSGYSTANLGTWGGFIYPDVLVFALGTNDAINVYNGTTTITKCVANLDAYLARTRARHVVIVGIVTTPYRHLNVYGPAWNTAAAKRATVFVDWAHLVQPGDLTADQTHHTAQGQAHYRQVIVDAVNRCP